MWMSDVTSNVGHRTERVNRRECVTDITQPRDQITMLELYKGDLKLAHMTLVRLKLYK